MKKEQDYYLINSPNVIMYENYNIFFMLAILRLFREFEKLKKSI